MSLQIEKQRAKSRRAKKGKFKIRVRYKYYDYKTIETEDYGSFREMYAKYKGKYEFWCADVPCEKMANGDYEGVRLDSNADTHPPYVLSTLQRFGKNKCWIDETYKINGKKVCLVFNASMLDSSVGATGTLIGGSVALSTVQRLQRERNRRNRRKAKGHYRKNRRGKTYRRR